jgi:hypothetical protein
MAAEEIVNGSRVGGAADEVGDIESKEVAGVEKAADGIVINMIGVEVVGIRPLEGADGGIGGGAGARGL